MFSALIGYASGDVATDFATEIHEEEMVKPMSRFEPGGRGVPPFEDRETRYD
jgi:hypothetical protein